MLISVGARQSPLSKAQVREVLEEMREHYPQIAFETHFTDTLGDRELEISLKTMGKTDFFTREVDQMVLRGQCRIAIHSAKDLPDPLSDGLVVAAITEGVDPSDVLVLRENDTLKNLKPGAKIAASTDRREASVRRLRDDVTFVEIRGTIQSRLDQLHSGKVDGIVMAEAAILRLGLTHLNRVHLRGEITPLQGQLAIVARSDDPAIAELFSCVDCR